MGSKFTTNVYVVRVVDGDSLWCIDGNSSDIEFEVRLFGVDAPELDQPYGTEAREHLQVLALGKNFWLDVEDVDQYDRVVGVLYSADRRASVNRRMVEVGLAFRYSDYGDLYGTLASETSARENRLGVWHQDGGGIRPWDWRRGKRPEPSETLAGCLQVAVGLIILPISLVVVLVACS